MQRSNLERSFVFYSRQFLEEQIKARGIKLKAANKKIDTMIEELAKFEKNGNDQGTVITEGEAVPTEAASSQPTTQQHQPTT